MVSDVIPQASPSASQPVSPADSASVPPLVQDAVSVDPNRPVSTIPADSIIQPASPSADLSPASESVMSGSMPTSISPADPTATASADSTPIPEPIQSADDSLVAPPNEIDARTQTQSNPMQSEPPADSPSSPISPQTPQVPLAPELSASPSSEPTEQGSIKDSIGVPEASSVQSSPTEQVPSASIVPTPETPPESAGINSEPPQTSQVAPSADSKKENVSKQTFGDLISESQPPSPPSQASDPPAQSSTEPVLPLPDLSIPSIPSIPPTPSQPQQSVPVGTGTPDLSEKRKQAVEARKQKVIDHLEKIVVFVGQKGKASNRDIRDVLHVSQTTVSDYCHTLVSSGKLKREGKAKATMYLLP